MVTAAAEAYRAVARLRTVVVAVQAAAEAEPEPEARHGGDRDPFLAMHQRVDVNLSCRRQGEVP